eukprot:6465433-Ditylum_brightwellii.AAC.1
MTRWSCPDVQNSVRELARQGSAPVNVHIKPTRVWDGKDKTFQLRIQGMADSDYAKCHVTRRSVSGYATFLEDAPVTIKSVMQKIMLLSVTEAETVAGVQCVQDMLYVKRLLESMGLLVELPMILKIENSGAVNLANNWSIGGRTCHMETCMLFLCDFKESGIIEVH